MPEVRREHPEDFAAVRTVHERAFAPSREEADIVEALRASPAHLPELCLVALREGEVVGHIASLLDQDARQAPIRARRSPRNASSKQAAESVCQPALEAACCIASVIDPNADRTWSHRRRGPARSGRLRNDSDHVLNPRRGGARRRGPITLPPRVARRCARR